MDLLPYNFRTCQLCGIWYEDNHYFILKFLYKSLVLLGIIKFTLCQMLEVIVMRNNLDDLTESLFMTCTYAALSLKLINFVSRQGEMISLIDDFRLPEFMPKSLEERNIIEKCSKTAALNFISFIGFSQLTIITLLVLPFLENKDIHLPFKEYQLYDTSNTINFWIAYSLQIFAGIYGVMLNVSMDTMVYGFIIMAAGQYEINSYRLANAVTSLKSCIEHYILIQDTVAKIQDFFIRAIVPLFFISLITLCTSIFRMSQTNVASFEFFSLALYLFCMLYQIFFYCWFGNELEIKNKVIADAIYSSNWLEHSVKQQKSMWFVMLSTQRSSNISFHGQCGLSLNTFLWIVKSSYATFSVLQRSSL